MHKVVVTLLALLHLCLVIAQETSGSLSGFIHSEKKEAVEFATIKAIDIYTNAISGAISQSKGYYTIQHLSPSVYRVEVSSLGFEQQTKDAFTVELGRDHRLNFELKSSSIELLEIVVEDRQKGSRQAGQEVIGAKRIEETPTIFRSIQELSKSIPENNLNSFAGASHRFNNLNIDGVAANDVIGFQEPASGASGSQANGTPGSLAKTQAIGFAAIKQLSVKLSPFDGSLGNFGGANINVVTKNGTNEFRSSIFSYGNNQLTQGNYAAGIKQASSKYSDYQLGFNSGGPINRDRAFYFVNLEYAAARQPLTASPGSQQSNISIDHVLAIRDHLLENYNYDPGSFETAEVGTESLKIFARMDFNLNPKNKLTLRHNFVKSSADNLEWSANFFNFGSQGFRHNSLANSTVVELRSDFKRAFNKFNIGFNRVVESRDPVGELFPHLQIASSSSSRIFAGSYREASVFNTNFSTLQLSNKLSYALGSHLLGAGVQAQYHDVDYGFLSAWNGRWEYKSVDDFINDRPARVRGVYNVNAERDNFNYVSNNPAATLGVLEGAAYVQDKWNLNSQLDLILALRLDAQYLTQELPLSPLISRHENFTSFDNQLRQNFQLNPRFGFNYESDRWPIKLSGGTGLFSGRLPYLWFAYMEYISGTEYFNVDLKPEQPLTITETPGQLANAEAGITEVNLLDPAFRYPRDWKSNLGLEYQFAEAWSLGIEFSYTAVQKGLFFQTANRKEQLERFAGADNRPYYSATGPEQKISQDFTNVFVLANTDQGHRYNLSLNANRTKGRANSYLAYSYGLSKDISSTVRSSPAANYEWNQALYGNDPDLSYSNYDLRHKIVALQSYRIDGKASTWLLSLQYNGRSGSPFSFVYQGDLNRDGSSRNDLVYIPASSNEIELVETSNADGVSISPAQQWQNLEAYIRRNDYLRENRGKYAARNAARTPWNHELDMKISWTKELDEKRNIQLSADIINVLNLLNPNWGKLVYVPNVVNSSFSLLKFEGMQDQQPQYSFNIPTDEDPWVVDNFNSRWRMQFGLTLNF